MKPETVLSVDRLVTELHTATGPVNVVDNVSFELYAGESLGLVGESGSGKSMTALSILRLLPKGIAQTVGGAIWLKGKNLLDRTDAEMRLIRGREISMILQDPHTSLNPVFTAGNQLREALRLNEIGASRISLAQRAVDALRAVRVAAPEHRVADYPHQMSGGMKQRVVGAIAMAGRPSVLIADEPTTALDMTVQLQYLTLLEALQAETGIGMLFITHDFGIVARLCSRVAVMYAGRIVETGTTKQVFDNPSHPYTMALLASVPSMDRKVERLFTINGQPPLPLAFGDGCRFAPRCAQADARCRSQIPPMFASLGGSDAVTHSAACWRLEIQL